AGPAALNTEVVRVGRRIATGQVTMTQGGKETVRVVANFTDLASARGRTEVFSEPPKLPAPADCVDPTGGPSIPGLTLADRFEYRFAEAPGWPRGEPSGEPYDEFYLRFSDGRDPDTLSLAPMVDAAAPAVIELGEYASSTVELTVHVRGRPAPGWVSCRVYT